MQGRYLSRELYQHADISKVDEESDPSSRSHSALLGWAFHSGGGGTVDVAALENKLASDIYWRITDQTSQNIKQHGVKIVDSFIEDEGEWRLPVVVIFSLNSAKQPRIFGLVVLHPPIEPALDRVFAKINELHPSPDIQLTAFHQPLIDYCNAHTIPFKVPAWSVVREHVFDKDWRPNESWFSKKLQQSVFKGWQLCDLSRDAMRWWLDVESTVVSMLIGFRPADMTPLLIFAITNPSIDTSRLSILARLWRSATEDAVDAKDKKLLDSFQGRASYQEYLKIPINKKPDYKPDLEKLPLTSYFRLIRSYMEKSFVSVMRYAVLNLYCDLFKPFDLETSNLDAGSVSPGHFIENLLDLVNVSVNEVRTKVSVVVETTRKCSSCSYQTFNSYACYTIKAQDKIVPAVQRQLDSTVPAPTCPKGHDASMDKHSIGKDSTLPKYIWITFAKQLLDDPKSPCQVSLGSKIMKMKPLCLMYRDGESFALEFERSNVWTSLRKLPTFLHAILYELEFTQNDTPEVGSKRLKIDSLSLLLDTVDLAKSPAKAPKAAQIIDIEELDASPPDVQLETDIDENTIKPINPPILDLVPDASQLSFEINKQLVTATMSSIILEIRQTFPLTSPLGYQGDPTGMDRKFRSLWDALQPHASTILSEMHKAKLIKKPLEVTRIGTQDTKFLPPQKQIRSGLTLDHLRQHSHQWVQNLPRGFSSRLLFHLVGCPIGSSSVTLVDRKLLDGTVVVRTNIYQIFTNSAWYSSTIFELALRRLVGHANLRKDTVVVFDALSAENIVDTYGKTSDKPAYIKRIVDTLNFSNPPPNSKYIIGYTNPKNHWMAWDFHLETRQVYLYDSLPSVLYTDFKPIFIKLLEQTLVRMNMPLKSGESIDVKTMDTYLQHDSNQCGPIALMTLCQIATIAIPVKGYHDPSDMKFKGSKCTEGIAQHLRLVIGFWVYTEFLAFSALLAFVLGNVAGFVPKFSEV